MKSLRAQILALLVIVAAAFALRFRGLNSQLPQWTYWDGYVLYDQTQYLRGELQPEGPVRTLGYYPYLSAAVASVLPAVQLERASDDSVELLARARERWMRPRLASMLLSLFAVVGAWGIARHFVRPGYALLAAALTATSLLHITYSTAQRPHGAASGMTALAIWSVLYMRRAGGWRGTLTAAFGVGLAIAALQSGFATLVAFAIAWVWRKDRGRLGRDLLALVASALIVAVFVRVFYPFHFDDRAGPGAVLETSGSTLTLAGHTIHLSKLTGRGFWILGSSFALFDPVVTLLALVAAIPWLAGTLRAKDGIERELRRDAWVCLGYALPFFAVFGMYELTFERFALPVVPLLAVAAACGCERVATWLPRLASGRLAAAGFALVLALPVVAAWKLGTLRSEPDTFEVAARYVEEHALPGDAKVLLLQNFDLPSPYSGAALREMARNSTLYWTSSQRELVDPASDATGLRIIRRKQPDFDDAGEEVEPAEPVTQKWLTDNGVKFVVALQASRGLRDPSSLDLVRQLRKAGKRALLISPFGEPTKRDESRLDLGFGLTESGTALQILRTRTYGPQIEIFEL
jgi:hypothetical protein